MVEKLTPKPYARLYKMLGEDLIKDEKTALIELIKNSYDADATWVTVNFNNFGENFRVTETSEIVIEDNGDGMTQKTIREEWINPANPNKKNQKNINTKTRKGRTLQGEKGIGRFSMFKLGKTVILHTKHEDEVNEIRVVIDLSNYDDDYITNTEEKSALFLEDVKMYLSERSKSTFEKTTKIAKSFKKSENGTRLIISNLLGTWNPKKVREVYYEIAALQSISPIIKDWDENKGLDDFNKGVREFSIYFLIDGVETSHKKDYEENLVRLLNLIKEKSFLKVKNGFFNDKEKKFYYDLNNESKSIKITDPELKELKVYKRYFVEERMNFEDSIIRSRIN